MDTGNKTFKSPFQLTWIRDLPPGANTDAVTLGDILGDPLVAECWDFNYLHDIDFLLSHFDQDVRQLVKVNVVHGFWKKEDPSRLLLQVSSLNQQTAPGCNTHHRHG
jgi:tyrosyl-DNA phosphodiesterase-1